MGLDTGKYAYGLELYPDTFDQKRRFTYMACYPVSDSTKVPIYLLQRIVPAAKFAVFKVPGGLAGLGAAFTYIYTRWLPNSGYEHALHMDMERYDLTADRKAAEAPPVEILIPIGPRLVGRD
jgi:predicted transcriptional regulator YdeE